MAVTTEKSTQVSNADALPPIENPSYLVGGKLRYHYFIHTQGAAAGDDGSSATVARIPSGQGVIFKQLSLIRFTAFGASRVMDIGYAAHTKRDGTAVSAGADLIEDGRDVSAANAKGVLLGTGTNADDSPLFVYDSKAPIDIVAKVTGGTWPAGAVIEGWIVYGTTN